MSSSSGVVVYGRAKKRGVIDRGAQGSLFAVHFSTPVLCTSSVLSVPQVGHWQPEDRMILTLDKVGRAHDIAVMLLTQMNKGNNPVNLYPFDPRDEADTGISLRESLYGAVAQAVSDTDPLCVHLVRFDQELLGDPVAEELQKLGIAVETFDSNR